MVRFLAHPVYWWCVDMRVYRELIRLYGRRSPICTMFSALGGRDSIMICREVCVVTAVAYCNSSLSLSESWTDAAEIATGCWPLLLMPWNELMTGTDKWNVNHNICLRSQVWSQPCIKTNSWPFRGLDNMQGGPEKNCTKFNTPSFATVCSRIARLSPKCSEINW